MINVQYDHDTEWMKLILYARNLGLSKEEVRSFLRQETFIERMTPQRVKKAEKP